MHEPLPVDNTTLHDLGFEALPYLSSDAVSEILVYGGEHASDAANARAVVAVPVNRHIACAARAFSCGPAAVVHPLRLLCCCARMTTVHAVLCAASAEAFAMFFVGALSQFMIHAALIWSTRCRCLHLPPPQASPCSLCGRCRH